MQSGKKANAAYEDHSECLWTQKSETMNMALAADVVQINSRLIIVSLVDHSWKMEKRHVDIPSRSWYPLPMQ